MSRLHVAVVERGALADVLRGVGSLDVQSVELQAGRLPVKLPPGTVGIGHIGDVSNTQRRFIVIPGSDRREFFAWVNTYCSFATPLSQWCRVITQDELTQVETLHVPPSYGDVTAAWAGVVLGEAYLHVGTAQKLSHLSVTALQSCASFVAARAYGLWGAGKTRTSAIERYEAARALLGARSSGLDGTIVKSVWDVLELLSGGLLRGGGRLPDSIVLTAEACRDIQRTGFVGVPTVSQIVSDLGWPNTFSSFEKSGVEDRLKIFDEAVENLRQQEADRGKRQSGMSEFIVAYFAARLGGSGSAHVELIESLLDKHPMLALWYGMISALYRPSVWGVEFGGLARVAIKELEYPLRFDDPPRCDINYDELTALIEPSGDSNMVGFRGAMRRALNVEVELGVNGLVRIPEIGEEDGSTTDSRRILEELMQLRQSLRASTESVDRLESAFGLQGETRSKRDQSTRKSGQSSRSKGKTKGRRNNRQLDLES